MIFEQVPHAVSCHPLVLFGNVCNGSFRIICVI